MLVSWQAKRRCAYNSVVAVLSLLGSTTVEGSRVTSDGLTRLADVDLRRLHRCLIAFRNCIISACLSCFGGCVDLQYLIAFRNCTSAACLACLVIALICFIASNRQLQSPAAQPFSSMPVTVLLAIFFLLPYQVTHIQSTTTPTTGAIVGNCLHPASSLLKWCSPPCRQEGERVSP